MGFTIYLAVNLVNYQAVKTTQKELDSTGTQKTTIATKKNQNKVGEEFSYGFT